MNFDIREYSGEILEFLSEYTLRDIDYGVLDLTDIRDYNLRAIFHYLSNLLYLELQMNYRLNDTGIFRVVYQNNKFFYDEYGDIIQADSLLKLKSQVESEGRIWYVFDEFLARKYLGQ